MDQLVFGQSELQRICSAANGDTRGQMLQFRTALALSSAFIHTCNVVFDFEPFEVGWGDWDVHLSKVDTVAKEVAQKGSVDEHNVVYVVEHSGVLNLRSCLHRCSFANRTFAQLFSLKDQPYDSSNAKHEATLEQLWSNLKPDVRRSGGRITKEWGEIGFQGTDPMTDFRGMGILSLHQLVHFTAKYSVEAQRALADSNHPTRWYPFSVAGINITGFIVDLIRERLLDPLVYEFADVHNPGSDISLENGVNAVNDFYSTIFTRFNDLWVRSNPRDAMMFPVIFNSLKDTIRHELKAQAHQRGNSASNMGGPKQRKKGAHCKKKYYKRSHATKCRARDIDQIQDDLKVEVATGKKMEFEKDEDLPGLGQYYCTPCARHFIDAKTRDVHLATKVHKRRMKDVAQKQYTHAEAAMAAGKTIEKYTPAHPDASSKMEE
ncbi:TPA: hypothetical protein N0F65_005163 [Lagenidium giganteum]|uniref:ELMO domain-containing protein n=1 Tax=Lagenidium giganteum TaxID=4803 RepID=A0AAV2YVH8_9STRA|nr:TPA: hypothetical protein N0F65_005163 [Lagenidium giganteum]